LLAAWGVAGLDRFRANASPAYSRQPIPTHDVMPVLEASSAAQPQDQCLAKPEHTGEENYGAWPWCQAVDQPSERLLRQPCNGGSRLPGVAAAPLVEQEMVGVGVATAVELCRSLRRSLRAWRLKLDRGWRLARGEANNLCF